MSKPTGPNGFRTAAMGLTAAFVLTSCQNTGSPAAATPLPSPSVAPQSGSSTPSPRGSLSVTKPTPSVTSSVSTTRRIVITVKGKQVTPAPAMVSIAVGEPLTITVISDHDDELHAHGFGIEKEVKGDQPLVLTVKGGLPGVYEVELHHPELRLLQVAVR